MNDEQLFLYTRMLPDKPVDIATCDAFVTAYPHLASGLCFLYGVLRGSGMLPAQARALVEAEVQAALDASPDA